MKSNPYDKTKQETEYVHWQAGYEAKSEDECPYEKDDSENRNLYSIWMKGYKAGNKTNKQEKVEEQLKLDNVPTDVLEKLLIERKSKELEQLIIRRDKLQETMNDINNQIVRLEILCGK